MDWIPYIASGVALFISSLCATLGYRRTHDVIPQSLNAHEAAIDDLRRQHAALTQRVRRVERDAAKPRGPIHGA